MGKIQAVESELDSGLEKILHLAGVGCVFLAGVGLGLFLTDSAALVSHIIIFII